MESRPSLWAFPNPAQTQLTVLGLAIEEVSAISISGQRMALKFTAIRGVDGAQVDVSELASGVYTLEVQNASQRRAITFVKD
jgi:hypothetical protein